MAPAPKSGNPARCSLVLLRLVGTSATSMARLPTTIPSAEAAARAACSGVEIPWVTAAQPQSQDPLAAGNLPATLGRSTRLEAIRRTRVEEVMLRSSIGKVTVVLVALGLLAAACSKSTTPQSAPPSATTSSSPSATAGVIVGTTST